MDPKSELWKIFENRNMFSEISIWKSKFFLKISIFFLKISKFSKIETSFLKSQFQILREINFLVIAKHFDFSLKITIFGFLKISKILPFANLNLLTILCKVIVTFFTFENFIFYFLKLWFFIFWNSHYFIFENLISLFLKSHFFILKISFVYFWKSQFFLKISFFF